MLHFFRKRGRTTPRHHAWWAFVLNHLQSCQDGTVLCMCICTCCDLKIRLLWLNPSNCRVHQYLFPSKAGQTSDILPLHYTVLGPTGNLDCVLSLQLDCQDLVCPLLSAAGLSRSRLASLTTGNLDCVLSLKLDCQDLVCLTRYGWWLISF